MVISVGKKKQFWVVTKGHFLVVISVVKKRQF